MKSMNTKKIAAVAAGAALLGGALLGAVSFENTELINNNGQIMAKVVVGEKAAASDGVAAANIAAVLGNRAFKQVAVSATPTGLDALTCSGTGAGTCEVLSKSVTLEVTTPAGTVPAGAYGFKTLITDYVDADLEDRNNTAPSDKENTPWGTIAAMKVGGDDFPALADYTVKDPQSTFSTTEEQYAYVTSEKVHYDDDESEFLAEQVKLAYEIEFMDDGIPLCSDSKSGYWAYCVDTTQTSDNNVDKALENHRVKVKFLGDEWIISGMDVEDDTVKLAKESAYSPKLQIGESLDLGDGNKLVLGDLKPASGGQTADIAIFSVKDASGKEIASKTVAQGATTEIQAGTKSYRVRVYQVAPGYTLTEKWAEVAVFADELELIDGDELEGNEDAWEVAIEWSDKDANTGDYSNSTIKEDHLTKIQLKGIDYADLYKGDYMTIVEDPAKFKLTFTGLDLTDKDYLKVSVTTEKAGGTTVYDVNTTVSDDTGYRRLTGDNSTTNKESQIKIKADDGIFTVYDEDGKKFDKVSELLFSPFGAVNYSNKSVWLIDKAALFFKKDSKYYRAYNSSGNVYTTAGTSMEIPYELSGDTFNMYIG
ncbi:MAG: S-layer protein, partial [Candidatus Micrarchaeota archaeon]|nr:S-layer protein [Candidatus Micrarchaeota archaeon]